MIQRTIYEENEISAMLFNQDRFDDVQRALARYKQTFPPWNKRIRIAEVTTDDCKLMYLLPVHCATIERYLSLDWLCSTNIGQSRIAYGRIST